MNVCIVICSSYQMHSVFSIYALSARFCSLTRNADRLTPTRENMNPSFGIDSPMDTPMDGRHGYGTVQTKQLVTSFYLLFI